MSGGHPNAPRRYRLVGPGGQHRLAFPLPDTDRDTVTDAKRGQRVGTHPRRRRRGVVGFLECRRTTGERVGGMDRHIGHALQTCRRLCRQRAGYAHALVTLTDSATGKRRDYWLGPHGSPESREAYHRVLAEWEANGRRLIDPDFEKPAAGGPASYGRTTWPGTTFAAAITPSVGARNSSG